MYEVYMLQSLKDSRTYVGYTANIENRLKEHRLGKVDATRNRRPLKVLFVVEASSLEEAKKREKYWKSGGGRRRLKSYFKSGFPPNLKKVGRGSPK